MYSLPCPPSARERTCRVSSSSSRSARCRARRRSPSTACVRSSTSSCTAYAAAGRIVFAFPLFVRKIAPVSGVASLLDYDLRLSAELADGRYAPSISVSVPVTSLCPCSKEISEYGAHNQRSVVTIGVRLASPVTVTELVRIAEEEASCELFGILKRADEKYVTERAYDNPRFVEDLVRGV